MPSTYDWTDSGAARLEGPRPAPGYQLGILLGVDLGGLHRHAGQADNDIEIGAQLLAGAVGLAKHRIGLLTPQPPAG